MKTTNDLIITPDSELSEQGIPLTSHFMSDGEPVLIEPASTEIEEQVFAQQQIVEQAKEYNAKLHELDDRYSEKIQLLSNKILVRTEIENPTDENGMFIGFGYRKIPSPNDPHKMIDIPNPYPYTLKAIIVNSDNPLFEKGEWVQLHPQATTTMPLPGTSTVICPKAFQLFNAENTEKNPFEHFGYLMLRAGDIECKLIG